MCCGCWEEAGGHALDTPKVRELARALEEMNPFGPFHIVVDDNNLETEHIQWCYEHRFDWGEQDSWGDPRWTPDEQSGYELLLAATLEERVSAMGLYDGCWR